MAKIAAAARGDLGELVTLLAQEAVLSAGGRVAFFFDFRGPCFNVSGHRHDLEALIRPLLHRCLADERCRAVFFSVDVMEHVGGCASVLLQVAQTPAAVTGESASALVDIASQSPLGAGSAEDEDIAHLRAICERLGGGLLIGASPTEGTVIRADLFMQAKDIQKDKTAALEHGAEVWLIGEPQLVFESAIRRFQRLGWTVRLLPSVREADARLAGGQVPQPDVVIGAENYNVTLPELVELADRLAPRTAVYATVMSASPLSPDEMGLVGHVQVFVNPLSPSELYQLTVRALAKTSKVLRVASLQDKALKRRPRALLVEDNPLNQLLCTELLQLFGFEVAVAGNGKEALDQLEHDLPAIIIMDINMPVMDGLETTRRIRQLERGGLNPHIPIVAATAQTDDEMRKKVRDAGMNGFVSKPIEIGLMQQELARVLQTTSFDLPLGNWRSLT